MPRYILIGNNDIFHDLAILFLDQVYYKKRKYIKYDTFMKAMKEEFKDRQCQYITYKFVVSSFFMGVKYKTEVEDITLFIPSKWIKRSGQEYIIDIRQQEPPEYNQVVVH